MGVDGNVCDYRIIIMFDCRFPGYSDSFEWCKTMIHHDSWPSRSLQVQRPTPIAQRTKRWQQNNNVCVIQPRVYKAAKHPLLNTLSSVAISHTLQYAVTFNWRNWTNLQMSWTYSKTSLFRIIREEFVGDATNGVANDTSHFAAKARKNIPSFAFLHDVSIPIWSFGSRMVCLFVVRPFYGHWSA